MEYQGYNYEIFKSGNYWHWTLTIDKDTSISTMGDEGQGFQGKDSQASAQRSVKAYINALNRKGF